MLTQPAPAPAIIAPAPTHQGDQFPGNRCAPGRHGGQVCTPAVTAWFHVSVGGDEVITYPDGSQNTEFVLDGFKVQIEDSYLGLGDREQILAAAASYAPDKAVIDFWRCKAPAAEF